MKKTFPKFHSLSYIEIGFEKGLVAMSSVNSAFISSSSESIWDLVRDSLEEVLGEGIFLSWISNLHYESVDAGVLRLSAINDLVKSWVEKNYLEAIQDVICQFDNQIQTIEIQVKTSAPKPRAPIRASDLISPMAPANVPAKAKSKTQGLHYRHATFDNFVVGDCNRMAYSAARTVADAPGRNHYNPLVLWGRSGQGKTHLLQAIGHFASSNGTAANVVYRTADDFLKEYMQSVREKKAEYFCRRYDSCDILILDDIQFLAKKERTQEELYKILSRLLSHQKQIVLSCDQAPHSVENLDARLLGRFEGGLTCALQSMNLETRLAFLRKKAAADGFGLSLDDEAFRWLAMRYQSNARELEGVLVKLIGLRDLMGVDLTLESIRNLVGDIVKSSHRSVSIKSIAEATAHSFGVKVELLSAKSRVSSIALPRKVAMMLSRELTDSSLEAIGFHFNRDYSTVIAGLKSLEKDIEVTSGLIEKIEEIRNSILA